jgi:hypothetical protein
MSSIAINHPNVDRRVIVLENSDSPWGQIQESYRYAEGIYVVSTASHGGMHLSPQINEKIPHYMRRDNGWYEEDCEIAIPIYILGGDAFENEHAAKFAFSGDAEKTVMEWFPYSWERYTGKKLLPGQSHKKDEDEFLQAHKMDWLVISAISNTDGCPHGFTKVTATLGGSRCPHATRRQYLVPSAEYANHKQFFYFPVDLKRHPEV